MISTRDLKGFIDNALKFIKKHQSVTNQFLMLCKVLLNADFHLFFQVAIHVFQQLIIYQIRIFANMS